MALRQSEKAKQTRRAHNANRTSQPSLMEWDRLMPLVGFVNEHVPSNAKVILLGDGKGTLATFLERKDRAFVNVELGRVENPAPGVEQVIGDMEERIPVARENGRPHAIVTPFSLEYTSIPQSSRVIADYLMQGERLICLCHHYDGYIIEQYREALKTRLKHDEAFKELTKMLLAQPLTRFEDLVDLIDRRLHVDGRNAFLYAKGCRYVAVGGMFEKIEE